MSISQRGARASAFNLDAAFPPPPGAEEAREALLALRERVRRELDRLVGGWRDAIARDEFLASARNLADYLALRRQDLSALQASLSALGLSSLGRCESHVMANLDAVAAALARVCGGEPEPFPNPELWSEGARRLREQRRALFGGESGAAIMVTLPTEAASDPRLVDSYVAAGMDCARINCAHDSPRVWRAMVEQVRRAAALRGRPVPHPDGLAGAEMPHRSPVAGTAGAGADRRPPAPGATADASDAGGAAGRRRQPAAGRRRPAGRRAGMDRRRQDPRPGRGDRRRATASSRSSARAARAAS